MSDASSRPTQLRHCIRGFSQACPPLQTQNMVHPSLEKLQAAVRTAAPDELKYYWRCWQSTRSHCLWWQNKLPTIPCWVHIWWWLLNCGLPYRNLHLFSVYIFDEYITGWWKRAECYWWCITLPWFGVPRAYPAFCHRSIRMCTYVAHMKFVASASTDFMSALSTPSLESEKRPVFDTLMKVALPMPCSVALHVQYLRQRVHKLLAYHLLCHCVLL